MQSVKKLCQITCSLNLQKFAKILLPMFYTVCMVSCILPGNLTVLGSHQVVYIEWLLYQVIMHSSV